MTNWQLVVHGGCGELRLSPEEEAAGRGGDAAAVGRALDAVEAAARVLEDNPAFNAGRGSVLAHDGHIELDAAIMDGRTRAAGAVAGLTTIRSPIGAARAVMEHSPHVLLSFGGAEEFAREHGLETVDPSWFEIPERRAQLA